MINSSLSSAVPSFSSSSSSSSSSPSSSSLPFSSANFYRNFPFPFASELPPPIPLSSPTSNPSAIPSTSTSISASTSPSSLLSHPTSSKLIKLNVGGEKYVTTHFSLFSKGENFLTSMVRNELSGSMQCLKDDDGSYFIDRNGDAFSAVLEYLRTGNLFLDSLRGCSREQILIEFDFYQISLPLDLLQLSLRDSCDSSRPIPLGHTAAIDSAIISWRCKARTWLEANLEILDDIIMRQIKVGNIWAYITFTQMESRPDRWSSGLLEIPSEQLHAPLWRLCLTEAVEMYSDKKVSLEFNSTTSVTLKWSNLLSKQITEPAASRSFPSTLSSTFSGSPFSGIEGLASPPATEGRHSGDE